MTCNVPVVSTDVGEVRERLDGVSPGGAGSDEDELVELVCGVLESDRRPDRREAVKEVSWDRIGDWLMEIYKPGET